MTCVDLNFLNIKDEEFFPRTYKNAMEQLVHDEVDRQIKKCSFEILEEVNCFEVVAYALNRLPGLYATSEEGLYRQKKRGEEELKYEIQAVVRETLKLIQKKPIRFSTPLPKE